MALRISIEWLWGKNDSPTLVVSGYVSEVQDFNFRYYGYDGDETSTRMLFNCMNDKDGIAEIWERFCILREQIREFESNICCYF